MGETPLETSQPQPKPLGRLEPKIPSTLGPRLSKEDNEDEVRINRRDENHGSGTTPKFKLDSTLRFGQNKD